MPQWITNHNTLALHTQYYNDGQVPFSRKAYSRSSPFYALLTNLLPRSVENISWNAYRIPDEITPHSHAHISQMRRGDNGDVFLKCVDNESQNLENSFVKDVYCWFDPQTGIKNIQGELFYNGNSPTKIAESEALRTPLVYLLQANHPNPIIRKNSSILITDGNGVKTRYSMDANNLPKFIQKGLREINAFIGTLQFKP